MNNEIIEPETDKKRECPYCKSHRIESMGFRDSTNMVRRFRCKNPECLKSHSRDVLTGELTIIDKTVLGKIDDDSSLELPSILLKNQRANKTLNIRQDTKDRIRGLKLYDRETDDDIINRLCDEHYGKIKR